jgi:hypothetical protein
MKTLPVIAPTLSKLGHDWIIPDELVGRLCDANDSVLVGLSDKFTPEERAYFAMFCYRKAHLQEIGLLIAATCELSTLIEAFGRMLGDSIFTQSRTNRVASSRWQGKTGRKIRLATASKANQAKYQLPLDHDDELEDENN